MNEALKRWFVAEILPHEAALMRYLTRVWPRRSEVNDLRQDIYVRIYERARHERPTSPKAFLFVTARHLLIDRIRRERIVTIDTQADLDTLNVLVDELSPERKAAAHDELRRLARAFDGLSDMCRQVVWLCRIEGVSQREAAERLGMHIDAIESQIARGMRALTKAAFGMEQHGTEIDREEKKHGQR